MRIIGTPDDDTLIGQLGSDFLRGGRGVDIIGGGWGDDVIHGGKGNDLILGEAGTDVLFGGKGADTFFFTFDPNNPWLLNGDFDRIKDFHPGKDEIRLVDLTQSFSDTPATLAYDADTGFVSVDIDGPGVGQSVRMVRIQKHMELHDGDLMIY